MGLPPTGARRFGPSHLRPPNWGPAKLDQMGPTGARPKLGLSQLGPGKLGPGQQGPSQQEPGKLGTGQLGHGQQELGQHGLGILSHIWLGKR